MDVNVEEKTPRTATLYAKVKPVNVAWVRHEARSKGYLSMAEFLDKMLDQLRMHFNNQQPIGEVIDMATARSTKKAAAKNAAKTSEKASTKKAAAKTATKKKTTKKSAKKAPTKKS